MKIKCFCPNCGEFFANRTDDNLEAIQNFGVQAMYKCGQCNARFLFEEQLFEDEDGNTAGPANFTVRKQGDTLKALLEKN